jgi:polar amino acid transport system substrate-binding protein
VTITLSATLGLACTLRIGLTWRARMWRARPNGARARRGLHRPGRANVRAMTTQISPALRSELAPSGTLRVGVNHQNFLLVTPGSSTTDPRGVAPDLGRELGRRLGVPVAFVSFDAAGKLADGVRTGAWDVAFLGAEPQRAAEIAFTAAYLEIPATYLVPAGSPIRSIADVDRAGVRIAVAEKSAFDLWLQRNIQHARLVHASGLDASLDLFLKDKLDVLSGLRPKLLMDVQKLPGARVLDGQFMAVQQAIGTPKAREAGAGYLRAFVEDAKVSGLVAELIRSNGVQGVSVAPPSSR